MPDLLNTDDFTELLTSRVHLVADPRDENETLEQRRAREQAGWASRGLELSALEAYAVWEGTDTLETVLQHVGVPAGEELRAGLVLSPDSLKALLAATAEMAFSVGWHMHDRLLTKAAS